MRELFRVIPYRPAARSDEPGNPNHVPAGTQGAGRVDNADLYRVSYLSDTAAGAIGEVFARRVVWRPSTLRSPLLGDLVPYALVRFRLRGDDLLDLDAPENLLARDLRPSRVVATDREITQAWARTIFHEGAWSGVSWWSRWDARWTSFGIWRLQSLTVTGAPEPLDLDHPALREAADILGRRVCT